MKGILKFVSVLMLLGAFNLVMGVMDIALLENSGEGGGFVVGALVGLAFVMLVVSGLLDIIGGLLGLRAAKAPEKAGGAVVFGLLSLIAAAVSVGLEFNVQNLCACIVPLAYFLCALSMKSRG